MGKLRSALIKMVWAVADWRLSPPQPVDLVSRLPFEVCRERLRPKLRSHWLLGWSVQSRGLVGWIKGTKFHAMKHILYANPFQTFLSATLLEEGGKTSIRCQFGLRSFTIVYFGLFLTASNIISLCMTEAGLLSVVIGGCRLDQGKMEAGLSRLLSPLIFPLLVLLFIRFFLKVRSCLRSSRN